MRLCAWLLIFVCTGISAAAQKTASQQSINGLKQVLTNGASFIENKGQYGKTMAGHEDMGALLYGYEGLDMPILFTPKGLIHLQRKIEALPEREKEKLERQGKPEEEIERERKITDRTIAMEWMGANPNPAIIAEDKTYDYHTYGQLQAKAYGYKKITYKNIYPGIDIVYTLSNDKAGFEYSLIVQPGADVSVVKLKYGGDVKNIKTGSGGNIIISSDINGISESLPVSYYGSRPQSKVSGDIKTTYSIVGNQVSFAFPQDYDHSRAMVIDPFVTATGNLIGLNAGKAKDVDFDYAGNIYVTGGGDGNKYQLAKYNAAGVLLWTFNGTQGNWTFGPYYGGWVVEKPTGNIYLGQGFNFSQGFIVIRIHTTGLYDNYTTTGNPNFRENWKMIWNCNSGSPQILVAGGGTNSNINMGTFTPPSVTVSAVNISGIPSVAYQDMADMVIDPVTNAMYTTYAAGLSPSLNNAILKHTQPYSAGTIAWQVQSGFPVLQEAANRPYLGTGGFGLQENSVNMLAVNTSYLYYWNGKDLKAIDKTTGATVGTPLTVASNTAKMQGGIIADACNNVFVGDVNGTIKVYKFNGASFDDAAAPDITVAGFGTKSVYDLAYDESKKILYASGDGFVASFDVSTYCPTTAYTLNVVPNCVTASATATLNPLPPLGSTVTYALYNGTTLITTNTTGVFTGLSPNVTYTIIATINLACSGTQATTTFTIPGPVITTSQTNTTCGASTGTITAAGSGSAGPYTYNINGGAFGPSGNFTGLAAGNYTIVVKDAGGCPNTTTVTIINSNGPALTYTQVNADCGNNTGNVTANATGGTTPYQYSINGGTTYQLGSFFTGLTAGQYVLVVKDAALCTNTTIVTITSTPSPALVAIPAAASCGNNNGSITAFGSGGTGTLSYSINGNTFQPSNTFANLTPGSYTVTVKDANGCTKTAAVTVGNSPAPTITATSTPAACGNVNGTITATGAGGLTPLQYSIDGISFQLNNVFTGLAAGVYTVTVQDASGCTKTVAVSVINTGGPVVTATSLPSGCGTSTGSITAIATGTAPFQYSINGVSFQVSNLFTGLASGNYVVYARDAGGCIGTFSIVVTNVAGPSISAVVTPASCSASDGIITATGSLGTPPYQYSKDGFTFGASNVFTGLSGNTIYTITVKDFNNCISTTTVTVNNVAGLTLAVSTISSSCSANSGVITATATGGTAPLTYSINGTVYQAGNIFNGLLAGSYTVYVKDGGGCIVTKPATVSSVTGPSVTATVQLNATCSAANGVIIATGSGGALPLTYSINGTVYQASNAFLNVAAGTYTVYVKDATGCIATQAGLVVTNSGVGAGISTFTVVTKYYPCNGDVVGKITNPRVNGANCGTCTFSLDFGAYIPNATQLFLNVAPGIHYVTAKDANGCTKTIQVNLAPTAVSTGTTVVTATACNTSNGSIVLTGIGPNTPYHASINGGTTWVTFDPSTTFAGLAGGVYTIIIADDASFTSPPDNPGGCTSTLTVIVPSTGGPSLSTTQTNGSCLLNDGTITAAGTLGTPPLNYNINGGAYQTSGLFTGLGTGTYTVNVQDGTGCISTKIVTITNPPAPSVTAAITPAACGLNNGSVTATGTGGTAPLQYSIDGFAFQTSNIFNNIAPGTYTLYVRDASTCYSSITVVIANTPLPAVTAFTIAASCNNNDGSIVATGSAGTAPYTYSINGTVYQSSGTFSGLAAGFYTVTIKDDRGCTNTTGITVGNIGAPTFTTTTISAKCGNANGTITVTATGGSIPYQYSSDGGVTYQPGNILTPLAPGTYTVVVKDANGCITAKAVLLPNIAGPQTLTATIINAACSNANGSITAAATGGTAPLQYSIDGTTYQPATLFSALAAGPYTLYVKDANGCIKTLPVTVLNLPAPILTLSMSPASCGLSDGTITAAATGGTLPLTYSKNGILFQASNIFTGLAAGPYSITVKDARNCIATANITVTILGTPVTPTFAPVAPICAGAALAALPTTSINGITGTWSPALNNTTTTLYTFTPGGAQCATTTTLTITVNPKPAPILIYHN
jgi:SprB repeat